MSRASDIINLSRLIIFHVRSLITSLVDSQRTGRLPRYLYAMISVFDIM